MTPAWDCTDTRQALGVYVLGAIDPAERSQVDRHVTGCRECRDELAGLAGLPALLSRVSVDEVGRISGADAEPVPAGAAPPEDFVESVLSLTAARRRRNRRWQAVAAAAAVDTQSRLLVVLPMFHANAQYYSFAAAISEGGTVL